MPSDVAAQVSHTIPKVNGNPVQGLPPSLGLWNLDQLNRLGGPAVFLTSKEGASSNPSWFNGVAPDATGKTQGAISSVIVTVAKSATQLDVSLCGVNSDGTSNKYRHFTSTFMPSTRGTRSSVLNLGIMSATWSTTWSDSRTVSPPPSISHNTAVDKALRMVLARRWARGLSDTSRRDPMPPMPRAGKARPQKEDRILTNERQKPRPHDPRREPPHRPSPGQDRQRQDVGPDPERVQVQLRSDLESLFCIRWERPCPVAILQRTVG